LEIEAPPARDLLRAGNLFLLQRMESAFLPAPYLVRNGLAAPNDLFLGRHWIILSVELDCRLLSCTPEQITTDYAQ
jgi:hypothetical protein